MSGQRDYGGHTLPPHWLTSGFANGVYLVDDDDKEFAECSVFFPGLLSCLEMGSATETLLLYTVGEYYCFIERRGGGGEGRWREGERGREGGREGGIERERAD